MDGLNVPSYSPIMLKLQDNLLNCRRRRQEAKLKLWRYAGLMLTYRCTAACRFCYYYCGPQAGGLMATDTAVAGWEGLKRIAGDTAKVHITGGEPFLVFDRLADIVHTANRMKLNGLDSVETNGDWGDNEQDIAEKLKFLDAMGMGRLKISWDPFHEEFVDIERVRRLWETGRTVLGPERVLVRWEHHLRSPTGIRQKSAAEKMAIFRTALAEDPCRFTGRAAEMLAHLAMGAPAADYRDRHCQQALLSSKGVHIDPYGHVFNGQCSGMAIGTIPQTPLEELWRQWQPDSEAFWSVLYHHGPFGLLDMAQQHGYRPGEKYASKCHLCADIRRFFFDKRLFPPIITPNACYGK